MPMYTEPDALYSPSPSRSPFMQAVHSMGGGLVAALLSTALAFSFGALIFAGPLQPFLGQGIAAALVTVAITSLVVAMKSSFRSAVAGPDIHTAALLAAMMAALAPAMTLLPPAQRLPLALTALAVVTLLTGLALFLVGSRRLGKFIRFVPYPVVTGFRAANGWLLVSGALLMVVGEPLAVAQARHWATPATAALGAITLVWAGLLGLCTRRFRHGLTLPLLLVAGTLLVHALLSSGAMPALLQHDGRLMFSSPAGASYPLPPLGVWFQKGGLGIDRAAWLSVSGYLLAVPVMALLSILLNSTSIEMSTGEEADLDRELRVQGLANLGSALSGGFVGQISVGRTLVNRAAGGITRWSGITVGLVALALLAGGSGLIGYTPRFILGGLLLMLGGELIWDSVVLSRRQLPRQDWWLVLAIVLVTAWLGFLQGLLCGVLAGCVIFAADVSRIRVVRHQYGLNQRTSSLIRSAEENTVLQGLGGQVQVLELGGYLFFGSAHSLQERVRRLVTDTSVRALIFDFSAVNGVDSSANACFTKIHDLLNQAGVCQWMVAYQHLQPEFSPGISTLTYDVLDAAIEAAEDGLLAEHALEMKESGGLKDWLTGVLDSSEWADYLIARLKPAPRDAEGFLCRQGMATDTLLFIEKGRVYVMLERPGLPMLRVRVFGNYTLAGEIGFFLNAPRTAALRATEQAVVWALSRESYATLGKRHPELVSALQVYVISLQAERLSFANRQITALQQSSSPA